MLGRLTRDLVGGLLILVGVVLSGIMLADRLPDQTSASALIATALGIILLIGYAASRRWWLLPLGCAVTTAGVLQGLYNANLDHFLTIWGVTMVGLGGLFVGSYLTRHQQWGWLLPGLVFWTVGGGLLITGLAAVAPDLSSGWPLTWILWLLAVQFFVVFAGNRQAWWAFTPAYLLWALGAGLRLTRGNLYSEALAAWALWALALLYWIRYLRDDTRHSRLWIAGGLTVGGALPLLFLPQPTLWAWVAIGISAIVGLAWAVVWWRQRKSRPIN